MTVTVDAVASGVTNFSAIAGATGQTSATLTVGASATALLVWLQFTNNTPTAPVAVWDSGGTNQSMTLITSASATMATGSVYLFGLVKPASGAKTLKCTWTGTGTGHMCAMSFLGATSASVALAFTNGVGSTPTGTTNTQAVSGATEQYVRLRRDERYAHI